jgi:hypothetical protein
VNVNPGELLLPRVANFPPYVTSAGSEVIDLMAQLNRPLDGWQAWIIERGLGQKRSLESGELEMSADTCGCWVSRQNGKGDIIMALEVSWLWLFGIPLVVHTAHQYRTAKEGFTRLKTLYEENEDVLGNSLQHIWSGAGQHGIELNRKYKRARLSFLARAGSAGLGFSAPKLIMDEGQMLTEDLMQTILPLMSAQVDPQVWFFGTPPRKDDAWIYQIKEAGEGCTPGTAWFDYGIEYIDPTSPEFVEVVGSPQTHRATNPSMSVHRPNGTRLRTRAIDGEMTKLGMTMAFAQERTGMWLPRARTAGDHSIDPKVWASRRAARTEVPGDLVIAFNVNTRRSHSTIMWVGKVEGFWRLGIADHRPGTDWLLPRLIALKTKYMPIAFTADVRGETTIKELKEVGIKLPVDKDKPKRGDLILPTMEDVATAFAMIVDATNNDMLRHHNEVPLNSAIAVPSRPLGGGATFDHKRGVEVGPATCGGLGMWAYRERVDAIVDEYDPLSFIR